MNELLRRLLLEAGLREDDVAARLGVTPKTVRRWLDGRVPYKHYRAAIVELLGVEEAALWPGPGILSARVKPDELVAVYPRREAIPRQVWMRFFSSAEREIGILDYSALFLAKDRGILQLLADKGRADVTIRIALIDPENSHAAVHGEEAGISDAGTAKVRNALTLYRSVADLEDVKIRLHQTVLYNSIYIADDNLVVNQHAYGIPTEHAPVFCLRNSPGREMATLYLDSFERAWASAVPLA